VPWLVGPWPSGSRGWPLAGWGRRIQTAVTRVRRRNRAGAVAQPRADEGRGEGTPWRSATRHQGRRPAASEAEKVGAGRQPSRRSATRATQSTVGRWLRNEDDYGLGGWSPELLKAILIFYWVGPWYCPSKILDPPPLPRVMQS
jgi:hypothetical protein